MESSVCATRFLFNDTATDVAASRSGGLPIESKHSVLIDRTPLGRAIHATILPATMGLDSSSLGRARCSVESVSDSKVSKVRSFVPFERDKAESL